MKFILAAVCFMMGSMPLSAQELQPKKTAHIEPVNTRNDTSHQQSRSNSAAMEHHSTSSWHYHRGTKRPQVQVEELPAGAKKPVPQPASSGK